MRGAGGRATPSFYGKAPLHDRGVRRRPAYHRLPRLGESIDRVARKTNLQGFFAATRCSIVRLRKRCRFAPQPAGASACTVSENFAGGPILIMTTAAAGAARRR